MKDVKQLLLSEPEDTQIIRGYPFAEYASYPALSNTALSWFCEPEGCPAKFKARYEQGFSIESEALSFGRAYHLHNLEPHKWNEEYLVRTAEVEKRLLDQAKLKGSKARGFSTRIIGYDRWLEQKQSEGLTIITEDKFKHINRMAKAIRRDSECWEALKDAGPDDLEVTIFFSWPVTKGQFLRFKARLDAMPGNTVIDLKSTQITNHDRFAQTCCKYGYDRQSAIYWTAYEIAHGKPPEAFGFLAQEKELPYIPALHWMPEEWIKFARNEVHADLCNLARAIRDDNWPGFGAGQLLPPAWKQDQIDAA